MTTPSYLYHYTSQKGLLGILESKKLWMTNILYLNDSSEYLGTFKMIYPELMKNKDIIKGNELTGNTTFEIIESLIKFFSSYQKNVSYIFSFSKNPDDINQWRGYCPSMGGFCIEFDIEKITTMIDKNKDYKIGRCIYKKEEKDSMINTMFGNSTVLSDFLTFIVKDSSFIKDESFKNENEYRLVCSGLNREIKYREGKSMVIPYVEFPPVDDDNKLPISKIWVGPTPHPELSKLSIENLLESSGYENVEKMVEISNIPYRSW